MVRLPLAEYLANKMSKIRVILQHGVKFCIGILLEWTPRAMDVIEDMENLIQIVVGRDIQGTVTVTIIHNAFAFQPSDINLVNEPNKWKTTQATQWNRKTRLKKIFDSNPVNYNIKLLFFQSPNQKLNLI